VERRPEVVEAALHAVGSIEQMFLDVKVERLYDMGVFEQLAQLVAELPVTDAPDLVAELVQLREQLAAKADLAVAALERSGEWAADGDVSLAGWLRRACALSTKDAHATARTARRLNELPVVADAYAGGALTRTQLACITANVRDETLHVFAEQAPAVLPSLLPLPPADLSVAMRHWAAIADDEVRTASAAPRRELHLSSTLDGRGELTGSFDAVGRETILAALRLASTWDADDTRLASERLADALVGLCEQHLVRHDAPSRNRNRPRVEVIVDVHDLDHARLADGTTLDRATTGRLLCDSTLHRVVTDGAGVILDYGRATRLVPRGLWDAVVVRDRHCRYAGCDRPAAWSEAHHVLPWEEGGPTRLDNLVLLCSRHHHVVHQPGFHAKLLPDGTFEVTTATGRHLESRPPPW
jgi:hypothetical protein